MNTKTTITYKCQWVGEGEGCEQSAVKGRSYCEQHLWQIYQQGSAVKRRKDQRRASKVLELESLMNDAVEELINEGLDL